MKQWYARLYIISQEEEKNPYKLIDGDPCSKKEAEGEALRWTRYWNTTSDGTIHYKWHVEEWTQEAENNEYSYVGLRLDKS